MDIQINQKIIKDRCGTVSFKKGKAFYDADKVTFHHYTARSCEATVAGAEEFHVTVKSGEGGIETACTCTTLPSFKNDCQHIAAVLIALNEHKRNGTVPVASEKYHLTQGLVSIFNRNPARPSGHQSHFENRQVLNLIFTCKPVMTEKGQYLLGVQINIGPIRVENIGDFLEKIKNGTPVPLSGSFTYDTKLHCFPAETDAVLQQLTKIKHDSDQNTTPHLLLIPPSSGNTLIPLLAKAPLVKLEYDGNTYEGLQLSEERLPLQFTFSEAEGADYQLKIYGFTRLFVMDPYRLVLYEGKLIQTGAEQNEQLVNLKQLLDRSGTNQIPIPNEQMDFFMEKVVPGLRKLGNVRLSGAIRKQYDKTPLVAKLYLDRVKNRLLAGLEFHYENVMINPLENSEPHDKLPIIRDEEKEKEILKLMDESSFTQTEGGYFLHNEELEYEFLHHIIPKLEPLVQIYATTAVRNRVFRANARPKIRVAFKKERTNWLEFKFEFDGIHEKHIRELLQALEEKRKYYRLRNGSLLSLETSEFDEIRRFLNAVPVQDGDLEKGFEVPVVKGLKLLDTVEDQDIFQIENSFRQFLKKIEHPDESAFEVPDSLYAIMRDYQKRGYRWMKTIADYGFGGVLADDMGLGKTLQSIAYMLSELPAIREKKLPALVVCPSSLTYNWLSEVNKYSPELRAIIIDGKKSDRILKQKDAMNSDVLITSYPLLLKDIQWYHKQSFHTAFFDEAQAFKNPYTQTAKAVKKIQAGHKFALTGTPVENSLEELWSIFHVVFPELLLGMKEFSNLTRDKVSRRIRPFLLRRLKEDVLEELPEKIESTESIELLPDQKKLYAAYLAKLKQETLKHLDKDTLRKNKIKILAGLTRLRQICCHPGLFVDGYKGSSAKFEQLMQLVEESRLSGRRVLIFSQFTKMLELIGRELAYQGLPFFYLDGQTPSEERVQLCDRFNEGERDLFLISLKAGGTGLNLTGADTVILYDLWWNPAVEEQAADRAHRMGQTKSVEVIKLISRGTIEEKINQLQEKKRDLVEEIIGDKANTSKSMSEEDIKEILMI
ncbi:Superfamily II DNA or RNA helicase, SNF2 family [Gracilibacillus ureilyticus]|uniref:Superfamily II DNA or RNA helicase, SNF2 family n=1 Tax=Gracilibacillus ureilyticus TaxID=531814 RepID=A0A1H9U762_9BACI|nr:DEAD/DEAH box helicase [Gracilibacillus ureilyticus]SES05420.1 Superfamily II DNA or RNA helicase, SNF2 family [Gracilibacillus ureilyticus]